MNGIRIVLPECSEDEVSNGLRALTEVLANSGREAGFGLGGSFGYGVEFDCHEFQMKPFCWCDREACRWCGEENAPDFLHKPTGFAVNWYKYIGRGMEIKNPNGAIFRDIINACIASAIEPPPVAAGSTGAA